MMRNLRRTLALLLSLIMVCSSVSLTAFAEDVGGNTSVANDYEKTVDNSDGISVVPKPNYLEETGESFLLTAETRILYASNDEGFLGAAEYLHDMLLQSTGYDLKVEESGQEQAQENAIVLSKSQMSDYEEEGYLLMVEEGGVTIRAYASAGAFYGVQTLLQLLPYQVFSETVVEDVVWTVPGVIIRDKPAYEWRGLMLDCSRQFFPADVIMRLLDHMAVNKLNVLHWHLTDDQGWRFEVDGYPNLTTIGATWENSTLPDNGKTLYYTKEELQQIVAYAEKLHITIVPEFEVPSHSIAALLSYPGLMCEGASLPEDMVVSDAATQWRVDPLILTPMCATKPEVYEFMHAVIDELAEIFPGEYIHIGGDEVQEAGRMGSWDQCPSCLQVMEERGYTDPLQLQRYIAEDLRDYAASKGKKVMGWSEIFNHGPIEGVALTDWIGGGKDAVQAGCPSVFAPTAHSYLDYYENPGDPYASGGNCTLESVYEYDPMPAGLTEEQQELVLGTQGVLWTHIARNEVEANFLLFPRMCAVAERSWTETENKSYDDFLRRMEDHYGRMHLMGIGFNIPEPVLDVSTQASGERILTIYNPAPYSSVIRYAIDGEVGADSPVYDGPVVLPEGYQVVKAKAFMDGYESQSVATERTSTAGYYHWTFDGNVDEENEQLSAWIEGNVEYVDGHDGKPGTAVYLGGAEDMIQLGMDNIPGDWTVSVWVNPTMYRSFSYILSGKDCSIRLHQWNGNNCVGISRLGVADMPFSYAAPLNTWTMLTFVSSGGEVKLYANGELKDTLNFAMDMPMDTIGNSTMAPEGLAASMDDLWAFMRALDESEIQKLYDGTFEPGADAMVTVQAKGTAGGTVSPATQQVKKGGSCTITVQSDIGYDLVKLTVDGQPAMDRLEGNKLTIDNLQAPCQVYAEFQEKPSMDLKGSHWTFDGTLEDAVGVNNGTETGELTYVEGRDDQPDGAVLLDGASDGIYVGAKDIAGEWTMSTWIKRLNVDTAYSHLMTSKDTSAIRLTQVESGALGLTRRHVNDYSFDYQVPKDVWQMLTITYHGNSADLYVDGKYQETLEKIDLALPMEMIGNSSEASLQMPLQAAIDELLVLPQAITEEQVAALYTGTLPELQPRTITSVEKLEGATVDQGTLYEEIFLPNTVLVTLSNGQQAECRVSWEKPENFAQAPGTYNIVGTLELPAYTENPDGLTAVYPVTVEGESSSSSSVTRYNVTVADAENGTVRVSSTRSAAGNNITVTLKPDEGYRWDGVTVTDAKGNEVKVTDRENGQYTFKMPRSNVTVKAYFAPEEIESTFTDVHPSDWYFDAVEYAAENGLMNGTSATTFSPNTATTRGMLVTILYRLEDTPAVTGGGDFTDVAADQYYADAVAWAVDNGIVSGYGNGLFGPGNAITRQQMAAILYRYAQYKGEDVSGKADLSVYADAAEVDGYAEEAMAWAVAEGLINGTSSDTLSPDGAASRAQVAAILQRFLTARK